MSEQETNCQHTLWMGNICAGCGILRQELDGTHLLIADLRGEVEGLRVEKEELRAEVTRLQEALQSIASIGGNLPDESLTDRTGPNDAEARGIMYCSARTIARAALQGSQPAPANEQFNCPPSCDRCGRCHLGECEVTAIIEIDPRDGNMTIKPVEPAKKEDA